jgi:hypothetical protein
VSAVLLLGGVGALPASADDPPPIQPPGITQPPTPTGSITPGPTYVITPGVGGSELGAPSDQKALDEATKADRATSPSGKPSAPQSVPTIAEPGDDPTATAVAGPQKPLGAVADPDPVGLLWRGIAAAVVMLVLFEITVVRRYLLRRRRPAVTAG